MWNTKRRSSDVRDHKIVVKGWIFSVTQARKEANVDEKQSEKALESHLSETPKSFYNVCFTNTLKAKIFSLFLFTLSERERRKEREKREEKRRGEQKRREPLE